MVHADASLGRSNDAGAGASEATLEAIERAIEDAGTRDPGFRRALLEARDLFPKDPIGAQRLLDDILHAEVLLGIGRGFADNAGDAAAAVDTEPPSGMQPRAGAGGASPEVGHTSSGRTVSNSTADQQDDPTSAGAGEVTGARIAAGGFLGGGDDGAGATAAGARGGQTQGIKLKDWQGVLCDLLSYGKNDMHRMRQKLSYAVRLSQQNILARSTIVPLELQRVLDTATSTHQLQGELRSFVMEFARPLFRVCINCNAQRLVRCNPVPPPHRFSCGHSCCVFPVRFCKSGGWDEEEDWEALFPRALLEVAASAPGAQPRKQRRLDELAEDALQQQQLTYRESTGGSDRLDNAGSKLNVDSPALFVGGAETSLQGTSALTGRTGTVTGTGLLPSKRSAASVLQRPLTKRRPAVVAEPDAAEVLEDGDEEDDAFIGPPPNAERRVEAAGSPAATAAVTTAAAIGSAMPGDDEDDDDPRLGPPSLSAWAPAQSVPATLGSVGSSGLLPSRTHTHSHPQTQTRTGTSGGRVVYDNAGGGGGLVHIQSPGSGHGGRLTIPMVRPADGGRLRLVPDINELLAGAAGGGLAGGGAAGNSTSPPGSGGRPRLAVQPIGANRQQLLLMAAIASAAQQQQQHEQPRAEIEVPPLVLGHVGREAAVGVGRTAGGGGGSRSVQRGQLSVVSLGGPSASLSEGGPMARAVQQPEPYSQSRQKQQQSARPGLGRPGPGDRPEVSEGRGFGDRDEMTRAAGVSAAGQGEPTGWVRGGGGSGGADLAGAAVRLGGAGVDSSGAALRLGVGSRGGGDSTASGRGLGTGALPTRPSTSAREGPSTSEASGPAASARPHGSAPPVADAMPSGPTFCVPAGSGNNTQPLQLDLQRLIAFQGLLLQQQWQQQQQQQQDPSQQRRVMEWAPRLPRVVRLSNGQLAEAIGPAEADGATWGPGGLIQGPRNRPPTAPPAATVVSGPTPAPPSTAPGEQPEVIVLPDGRKAVILPASTPLDLSSQVQPPAAAAAVQQQQLLPVPIGAAAAIASIAAAAPCDVAKSRGLSTLAESGMLQALSSLQQQQRQPHKHQHQQQQHSIPRSADSQEKDVSGDALGYGGGSAAVSQQWRRGPTVWQNPPNAAAFERWRSRRADDFDANVDHVVEVQLQPWQPWSIGEHQPQQQQRQQQQRQQQQPQQQPQQQQSQQPLQLQQLIQLHRLLEEQRQRQQQQQQQQQRRTELEGHQQRQRQQHQHQQQQEQQEVRQHHLADHAAMPDQGPVQGQVRAAGSRPSRRGKPPAMSQPSLGEPPGSLAVVPLVAGGGSTAAVAAAQEKQRHRPASDSGAPHAGTAVRAKAVGPAAGLPAPAAVAGAPPGFSAASSLSTVLFLGSPSGSLPATAAGGAAAATTGGPAGPSTAAAQPAPQLPAPPKPRVMRTPDGRIFLVEPVAAPDATVEGGAVATTVSGGATAAGGGTANPAAPLHSAGMGLRMTTSMMAAAEPALSFQTVAPPARASKPYAAGPRSHTPPASDSTGSGATHGPAAATVGTTAAAANASSSAPSSSISSGVRTGSAVLGVVPGTSSGSGGQSVRRLLLQPISFSASDLGIDARDLPRVQTGPVVFMQPPPGRAAAVRAAAVAPAIAAAAASSRAAASVATTAAYLAPSAPYFSAALDLQARRLAGQPPVEAADGGAPALSEGQRDDETVGSVVQEDAAAVEDAPHADQQKEGQGPGAERAAAVGTGAAAAHTEAVAAVPTEGPSSGVPLLLAAAEGPASAALPLLTDADLEAAPPAAWDAYLRAVLSLALVPLSARVEPQAGHPALPAFGDKPAFLWHSPAADAPTVEWSCRIVIRASGAGGGSGPLRGVSLQVARDMELLCCCSDLPLQLLPHMPPVMAVSELRRRKDIPVSMMKGSPLMVWPSPESTPQQREALNRLALIKIGMFVHVDEHHDFVMSPQEIEGSMLLIGVVLQRTPLEVLPPPPPAAAAVMLPPLNLPLAAVVQQQQERGPHQLQ